MVAFVAVPVQKLWPEYEPEQPREGRIDCTVKSNCRFKGQPSA